MAVNKKDSKGVTHAQHLKAFKNMGAPIPEIELIPVPEELNYLKTYWLQCLRGQVITYRELHSFSEMMQIDLQPWESSTIMQIDNIYWKSTDGNNSVISSKGGVSRGRNRK